MSRIGTLLTVVTVTALCGCAASIPQLIITDSDPVFVLGTFAEHPMFSCDIPLATELRLENHSADAASLNAPFDPERPTIAIIHGRNINAELAGCGSYLWPRTMADAMAERLGPRANLMVFNHDSVAAKSIPVYDAALPSLAWFLGDELQARGLNHDLHLIAHSGGAEIALQAAEHLGFVGQVTILDGGTPTMDAINANPSRLFSHVSYVDNYMVPLPLGLGRVLYGSETLTNVVLVSHFDDIPIPNHFLPVVWYTRTIENPDAPGGFNFSLQFGKPQSHIAPLLELNSVLYEASSSGAYAPLAP